MRQQEVSTQASTHALHTDRINLSPFTKDFRVWGALNENPTISLRLPSGSFLSSEQKANGVIRFLTELKFIQVFHLRPVG